MYAGTITCTTSEPAGRHVRLMYNAVVNYSSLHSCLSDSIHAFKLRELANIIALTFYVTHANGSQDSMSSLSLQIEQHLQPTNICE